MAASLNKVYLIGNLTRDPEMRFVTTGQPVTSFSIAVNRSYVTQTGEKREDVSYIRIVVWGRRAEVCNEYLKKGSPVLVEGRLQSRSWEASDGSKRSTIEVVATNVQFLGKASSNRVEKVEMNEFSKDVDNSVGIDDFSSEESSITNSDFNDSEVPPF